MYAAEYGVFQNSVYLIWSYLECPTRPADAERTDAYTGTGSSDTRVWIIRV